MLSDSLLFFLFETFSDAENALNHQASPSSVSEERQASPNLIVDTPLIEPLMSDLPANMAVTPPFEGHMGSGDNLLLPSRTMLCQHDVPIVRLDGSTGALMTADK